jgi:glyoxylase-like metal-dependent hydrolase (beta-lactamase superfamily II)
MTERAGPWVEVGDRVFTRRYRFFDQEIGVVLGRGEVLVVDTRLTHRQAREILGDLRELTRDPVTTVVDTHWHHDHAFGNHVFRPAVIWGHVLTPVRMIEHGERMLAEIAASFPERAEEIAEVMIDPPDRTFAESATLEIGGREIRLRHLGRGHTDSDVVIDVADADVLFAGDLLEDGATPFFGDGFPIDWPGTVERLLPLARGAVVPGHGAVGDRRFVAAQLADFRAVAALARRIVAGELDLDAAVTASPYSRDTSREPLERAVAQLRGWLD